MQLIWVACLEEKVNTYAAHELCVPTARYPFVAIFLTVLAAKLPSVSIASLFTKG
jgi:hypothetical protein